VTLAWRILKARYAEQAFDGEGARLHGGRWNSPGVRVVYASDSIALAALELLTQLNDATLLAKFVTIAADFDGRLSTDLDHGKLPRDWRTHPAPPELQQIGDAWAKRGSSLALRVPSAVVPQQFNWLLNPEHSDFARLKIGKPEPFDFDLRLLPKQT
jgi:RES domain-containing protein